MENKIWLGVSIHSGDREMRVPDDYELRTKNVRTDEKGIRYIRVPSLRWFTNLDHDQRHRPIILVEKYERTPEKFPKYDNYDAIEVSKTLDIPLDYFGVMGVPITFLDKYCPAQFEIVGMTENLDLYGLKTKIYTAKECRDKYFELFGKAGTYDLNAAGVINGRKVYQRILIRRRQS